MMHGSTKLKFAVPARQHEYSQSAVNSLNLVFHSADEKHGPYHLERTVCEEKKIKSCKWEDT